MKNMLQEQFSARYHELDPQNRVRCTVLLAWLQEAAVAHASQLGVSVEALADRGLAWVISRLALQLERQVKGSEPVTVSTWPFSREGRFSIRDFRITARDGTLIGAATTSWAAITLDTRRPVRIDQSLPEYPVRSERALDDRFEPLPEMDSPLYCVDMPVLKSCLDLNGHVNNTVYPGWAVESLPMELTRNSSLERIEINFRGEALYGDFVRSSSMPEPQAQGNSYIHRIERVENSQELCRLRTVWKMACN